MDLVDEQIEAVSLMEAHELAFRMQGELPPVIDLAQESSATQTLYGIGTPSTNDFGRQCLMARRLLEAGVRFVEVCHEQLTFPYAGRDMRLTDVKGRVAEGITA